LKEQIPKDRVKRDFINPGWKSDQTGDPLYHRMWYINPIYPGRNRNSDNENLRSLNISNVWEKGYSGKGVVVTIIDDGIERDHPEKSLRNWEIIF